MSKRPVSIVCALDLTEMSPLVVEHALAEARRHEKVDLHFTTVVETHKGRFSREKVKPSDLEAADNEMRSLVEDALPAFADSSPGHTRKLRFHTRSGKPNEEIVELAQEVRADSVVVGRHSSDKKGHRKPGGIAGMVVDEAPCSVFVVSVSDYDPIEEEEQCQDCIQTREETGGEKWFCTTHSEGRAPRLSRSVGLSSPTPGWGLF